MVQKNNNSYPNNKKASTEQKPSFVHAAPSKVKASKPSVISKTETIIYTILGIILFACVAGYLLIESNADMLFMAQEHSSFSSTSTFFNELAKIPGALVAWAGCYLTQFFYNPTIGASILISLWVITYFETLFAFHLKSKLGILAIIPIACLLISLIDTGYWLYYLKQPGYWFRETIGFMTTVCGFAMISRIKNTLVQNVLTILIVFIGYLAIGWYALLIAAYIIIDKLTSNDSKKSKITTSAVSAAMIVITPIICYNLFFPEMRIEEGWTAGFPRFRADLAEQYSCEYPFIIMAASPILLLIVARFVSNERIIGYKAYLYRLIVLAILIAIPYVIPKFNFDDYNYHAEMRMYNAADTNDWDTVLEESSNYEDTPTREMVMLNHIALFNKGMLGTHLFKYNNFGKAPQVDTISISPKKELNAEGKMDIVKNENGEAKMDTMMLKVHMVQTGAPLIYYYHAKTNFAYRWCIENSVEFGYSFNRLKIMARCAIVNEEWEVARKYINILKTSTFQKEWAEKYEPLLDNHKLIKDYHEFDKIIELRNHMGSVLDGDNGLCEMYLLNYFSNTMNKDSKLLQELTLAYALIQKDIQLFWPRFFLYAQLHNGEPMPVHYQEAAFLYGNLETSVDISKMPFSKEVKDCYAAFQQTSQSYLRNGMSVDQVREMMKPQFGNTFYWFYFFCRDVKSY